MGPFKSTFSHLGHKATPAVATNMAIDSWCDQLSAQPAGFVKKVQVCTALTTGQDGCDTPGNKTHHHTLLRVILAPTSGNASEDVLLIERVLSIDGTHHSVAPISQPPSKGGTLDHPAVHDHICIVSDGPSSALTPHPEVERTLKFGRGSPSPYLALSEFVQVLRFVSRTTILARMGGDCKYQSRSFAFTCLAALTPRLPPPIRAQKGMNTDVEDEGDMVDDSIFELCSEAFLVQIPWLVKDDESVQALAVIEALKDGPRSGVETRLYH
ncbi:hypothetical protein JVU11DRAFT_480 [Chiua virens]|nr:hypothetical protein JVU11DRAFT_480 [Chiua virens]